MRDQVEKVTSMTRSDRTFEVSFLKTQTAISGILFLLIFQFYQSISSALWTISSTDTTTLVTLPFDTANEVSQTDAILLDTNKSSISANGRSSSLGTNIRTSNAILCTREQIRTGQWQATEMEQAPYISRTSHLRCFPEDYYMQVPWKTWEWVPQEKSCKLSRWNAQEFCDLLPFATVSIIGDSLNWEMYSSLLQLLGQTVYQSSQHRSKTENKNHHQWACNHKTKLVWRNDHRLYKLTESFDVDFPTVLILNRGAHWVNDTRTLREFRGQIEEVRAWQNKCDDYDIKCHFFWRTSVPGHPGCENYTEPVNAIDAMESLVYNLNNYNDHTITYHWYDYQKQNQLFLRELDASGLRYEVIDGYDLNILRPDLHRSHQGDCLHNCYPGKMDVYNQLLLHFLKMQRSMEDAQSLEQRAHKYIAQIGQKNKT
jgi:hypothetical protein